MLAADGLHDSEIAERRRNSPNTVELHMSNGLGKLGMDARAEVAVSAAEHGLLGGGAQLPKLQGRKPPVYGIFRYWLRSDPA